jgi:Arc/MetJ-type ribon-helix-helix transcriptional regulator
MAILTIEITEAMLEFIDREIALGFYKDRIEFIETLIEAEMRECDVSEIAPDCYLTGGKIIFANEEQRERFEQKLETALDEHERGDTFAHQKGDFG